MFAEVDGKAVPEEEVGKATKVLRESEEKMANRSGKVPGFGHVYRLVMTHKAMVSMAIFNGKTHYKYL